MESGKVVQWNGDTINHLRPYRSVMFYNGSGAAIVAGAPVAIDTTVDAPGSATAGVVGQAIRAPNGSQDTLIVGGAVRVIPNLTWGEVVVQGVQEGVLVTGPLTAGALLECITAARLETMTAPAATKLAPVARNVTAVAGSGDQTSTVEWLNPGQY